ncbi:hypothetical protein FJZ26_04470 [Candidatus Parvarchaeota archaeon]|nr:hypothetical protein [Candidatus Parvarchaeota archaeon]
MPRQVCEQDIINESPALVMEQVSEIPHERKFDVYYHQKPGVFRRYVVTLNDSIRLITLMHTSKDIQNLVAGEDNKR